MARARNIKPAFFKNPELGSLPFEARLLFIALWLLADRKGRLEDRPARIAAETFPYNRDISAAQIDSWLNALADSPEKFIVRYSVDGMPFIQVTNFLKHQFPHVKEQESVIPPPPPREKRQENAIPAPDMHQTGTGHAPGEQSPGQCVAPPSNLNPSCLIPDSLNPDESQNPSPPLRGGGVSDQPSARAGEWLNAEQGRRYAEFRDLYWRGGGEAQAKRAFRIKVQNTNDWNRCRAAVLKQKPEMMQRKTKYRPPAHVFLLADFALLPVDEYYL